MVWLGISENGKMKLIFIPEGVKVNTKVYVTSILEKVVEPFVQQHFNSCSWIYQQDSAQSQKSPCTHRLVPLRFSDFLSSSE